MARHVRMTPHVSYAVHLTYCAANNIPWPASECHLRSGSISNLERLLHVIHQVRDVCITGLQDLLQLAELLQHPFWSCLCFLQSPHTST